MDEAGNHLWVFHQNVENALLWQVSQPFALPKEERRPSLLCRFMVREAHKEHCCTLVTPEWLWVWSQELLQVPPLKPLLLQGGDRLLVPCCPNLKLGEAKGMGNRMLRPFQKRWSSIPRKAELLKREVAFLLSYTHPSHLLPPVPWLQNSHFKGCFIHGIIEQVNWGKQLFMDFLAANYNCCLVTKEFLKW